MMDELLDVLTKTKAWGVFFTAGEAKKISKPPHFTLTYIIFVLYIMLL